MEMGNRKRMGRQGITSIAFGKERLARLDSVLALRKCTRSELIRDLVDQAIARYERVLAEADAAEDQAEERATA